MGALRLRIKIGAHEFEAEGDQETVLTCFERFRLAIEDQAPSTAKDRASPPLPTHPNREEGASRPVLKDLYTKLFHEEPTTGVLVLRAWPQTDHREADALLLLLLGYLEGKRMEAVPVLTLTKSLARSGYQVKRVDRLLSASAQAQHILKAGRGKGGKYRLTSQGVQQAEALAQELLSLLP